MIIYSNANLPATLPVSLAEMKLWLKLDADDTTEDALLNSLILAATKECEGYTGLSFITRTRTIKLTSFRGRDLILPYGPVTALTSITYTDEDGNEDTLIDAGDYTLDSASGLAKVRITDSWPYTNDILNNATVTYVAGYADAAAVPEVIKLAIKKRVAFHYEKRGDEQAESKDWIALLDTVKVYWNAEYCEY
jgi:uncharacterized phiE125 gp8 family phage protein